MFMGGSGRSEVQLEPRMLKIRDTQLRTSSFIDIQRHFSLFRFFFFIGRTIPLRYFAYVVSQYHLEERGRSLTECIAHCLSSTVDVWPPPVANDEGVDAIGEPLPSWTSDVSSRFCLGIRRASRRRQIVLVELGLPTPNATFHGT